MADVAREAARAAAESGRVPAARGVIFGRGGPQIQNQLANESKADN